MRVDPVPVVVSIHGSGWRGGQYRPPFQPRLFDEGIGVAAIIDCFTEEALFPAMRHDGKAMVGWLCAHAAHDGLAPRRFAAWCFSGGGHLALLFALTSGRPEFEGDGPRRDQDRAVCAVVNWCGPTDLLRTATDPFAGEGMGRLIDHVVGGPVCERVALACVASPLTHARPGAPPLRHVHGRRDPIVPLWHAAALARTVLRRGCRIGAVHQRCR